VVALELRLMRETFASQPLARTLCLALIAEGFTNVEVARALGVDLSTVSAALMRAKRRLGARTTHGAVAQALRQGMI
jgi:DNA-binding CsgD family transcriptional regulator